MFKKDICVDFDGVLNIYEKYDENNLGLIRPGCAEFLKTLSEKYKVTIMTCRNCSKVEKWLKDNDVELITYYDLYK